jgi:hypothetical protein
MNLSIHCAGQGWGMNEKIDWCNQNFGPNTVTPDTWSRWYSNGWVIRFRDEKDYLIFLLKWS